jgi:hemerythrin-like domain-containing protein
MDALSLLREDHQKVKKILQELDSTTTRGVKTREQLFTKLTSELTVHEKIEEEIFYPALKEQPKAKETVLEAYEEHHFVDEIKSQIQGTPFDAEEWGAKFSVMKENIEHHLQEEEGELFKHARELLGTTELQKLGERMQQMKEQEQQAQQQPEAQRL